MPQMHQGTLVVTRQPHYPTPYTRETVQHLVAFGLPIEQIATVLRATPEEVREYYKEELETGLLAINARVQQALLSRALYEGDTQAMKLWLMNKAGWRGGDSNRLTVRPSGDDGDDNGDTITVVQRRTIIDEVLKRVTTDKRRDERVIDGTVVPAAASAPKTNGTNGATHGANGKNGANGHGANGNGKSK